MFPSPQLTYYTSMNPRYIFFEPAPLSPSVPHPIPSQNEQEVAQIPPPSSTTGGYTSEKAERPKLTRKNKHGHIFDIPCAGTGVTKDSFNRLAGSFDREPNVGKGTKDIVISNILFLLLAAMPENSNSHLPVETQPFLKSHIRRGNSSVTIWETIAKMTMAKRAASINLYDRRANLFLRKENFLQRSWLDRARTGALFDLRRFRHNGKF
jgi:hypothetical protein